VSAKPSGGREAGASDAVHRPPGGPGVRPTSEVASPRPAVRPTLDGADVSQHERGWSAEVRVLADAAHLNVRRLT